jgi:hypothetical protein
MLKPACSYVLFSIVSVVSNFIRVIVSDPRGLGDAGWIYLPMNLPAVVGWSMAGNISVSVLLSFHNLVSPDNSLKPGYWAMASVGVIIGVFLWPFVEQWLARVRKEY